MDYETLSETEWERIDRIWGLLEQAEVEKARLEIDALETARPGHPDLRIVRAAVLLDDGRARDALQGLHGAERSADPALFFHLRAAAHYELAQFESARDDARRALAIHPDLAETHYLLCRALDHLGDSAGSERHAREAEAIDPDAFPMPLAIGDQEFDALVERSLRELPAEVRRHLEELPVLVEPLPAQGLLTAEDPPLSPDLLGLFHGQHLGERSHADAARLPGGIYLFRRNLLRACADREELEREVRITVLHEVGHLLGLDEDDLDRWGLG